MAEISEKKQVYISMNGQDCIERREVCVKRVSRALGN